MTAALLGLAWAVAVAGGVARRRRAPARVRQLRPRHRVARSHSWVVDRRVRAAAAFFLPLAVLPSPLDLVTGAGLAASMWLSPAWQRRRNEQRRLARLEAELPEVVDLLVLAVGAGLTVPLALDAVARRATGDLATELAVAVDAARHGHRLADALDALPARAGEAVRPLVGALVASERYGAPLTAGLERLAAEVRAIRRRRADEKARKVSVKLLFPLVVCILPAFALLTVAPLIASALRSLRL